MPVEYEKVISEKLSFCFTEHCKSQIYHNLMTYNIEKRIECDVTV
jgi:hypothetical protein